MLFFTFFSNKVDLSTNKPKQAISAFPDVHASLYLCDFSQVVAVLVNTGCEASVGLGIKGFLNPIEEGLHLVEQVELGRCKVLDLSEGDTALGAQESGMNRVVGTEGAGNSRI